MKVCDTIQMLESEKSRKLMTALYGEAAVDANIEPVSYTHLYVRRK